LAALFDCCELVRGYVNLGGSQLNSNDKAHWRGAATSNAADVGQVFQTLAILFSVCPLTNLRRKDREQVGR